MKKVGQFIPSEIKFLGEQDGVPERKLKTHLAELFSGMDYVIRAYLVRVDYNDSNEFDVALCIRTEEDSSHNLSDAINEIFANMFRTDEHLDVLYLTEEREIDLSTVCPPFFTKPKGSPLKSRSSGVGRVEKGTKPNNHKDI